MRVRQMSKSVRNFFRISLAGCAVLAAALLVARAPAARPAMAIAKPVSDPPLDRPSELRVNLLAEPFGIDPESLSFAWVVNDAAENEMQTAYQIQIATTARRLADGRADVADTGKVRSGESSCAKIDDLDLEPGALYYWRVRTWNKEGKASAYSAAQAMTTAADWADTDAIWEAGGGHFAFLRSEFEIRDKSRVAKAVVSVTAASPEASRQYVYNLYLNGTFIGMGPALAAEGVQYNSYDVTAALKAGKNAIGALNYAAAGRKFLLQMTVYYTDGSSEILLNSGRDIDRWRALDATGIYGGGGRAGSDYYTQEAENIDARLYPEGWALPGFDDSGWALPARNGSFAADALAPAQTENEGRYDVQPARVTDEGGGRYLVDLGCEIVGGLKLTVSAASPAAITLRSGEQLQNGAVVYQTGSGNTYEEKWTLRAGQQSIENFGMKNFRYVEITGCPVRLTAKNVRGVAVRQAYDEEASDFASTDPELNEVYDFVKYSLKATSQNLYVDSQLRERAVYEGDVWINMLTAYALGGQPSLARTSVAYLDRNGQWPAEYRLMAPILCWNDYLYTGDIDLLWRDYSILQSRKLYSELYNGKYQLYARATDAENTADAILVDWPAAERDGYDTKDATYNTVLNAVAYRSYGDMAQIASALGYTADGTAYAERADAIRSAMLRLLYNPAKGAFSDGLRADGTRIDHYAQHASAFALALGVADGSEIKSTLAATLAGEGIRGSTYEAFFYLKALYEAGEGTAAKTAMTSTGLRGWLHEIRDLGATITAEAWDPGIKPNMTYSHAWGTAPASQITEGLFGIRPLTPGYGRFQITFQPGGVSEARIKTPTVKGTIGAYYSTMSTDARFDAVVAVPANTVAVVSIPLAGFSADKLLVDGSAVKARHSGDYLTVTVGSGQHEIALP